MRRVLQFLTEQIDKKNLCHFLAHFQSHFLSQIISNMIITCHLGSGFILVPHSVFMAIQFQSHLIPASYPSRFYYFLKKFWYLTEVYYPPSTYPRFILIVIPVPVTKSFQGSSEPVCWSNSISDF